jgi:hypothetical protein
VNNRPEGLPRRILWFTESSDGVYGCFRRGSVGGTNGHSLRPLCFSACECGLVFDQDVSRTNVNALLAAMGPVTEATRATLRSEDRESGAIDGMNACREFVRFKTLARNSSHQQLSSSGRQDQTRHRRCQVRRGLGKSRRRTCQDGAQGNGEAAETLLRGSGP